MTTFKVNLENLRAGNLSPMLRIIEEELGLLHIDFYILGATARDAWFSANGITAVGTKDIDFAIQISNESDYYLLKENLLKAAGMQEIKEIPHRLKYNEHIFDLQPFGQEIEINGEVKIEAITLSVLGMKEVMSHGTILVEGYGINAFKVVTLPALIALKIIAYTDRPEHRHKDIEDIRRIMLNYFYINSEKIYEAHLDLMDMNPFKKELAAARVIGREMAPILNQSEIMHERITTFLKETTTDIENNNTLKLFNSGQNSTIEETASLLLEVLKGINEER